MKLKQVKTARGKLSVICFYISSWFLFAGQSLIPKDKGPVTCALPLPGWGIVHNDLQFISPLTKSDNKKLKRGICVEYYTMPDKWISQTNQLIKKGKRHGVKRRPY